ncbi:transcription factor bHLH30 [Beta vulgaris subsp. vulgaris]|uniref:transcription factor bHLH30 n=1 Tax=Beta vulgaris subsp. vulgaris TaxID=3555 RepID=UPI002036E7C1|nr:transcription factor bHLH30 [Beta vulgaris subsp. vulgaris]
MNSSENNNNISEEVRNQQQQQQEDLVVVDYQCPQQNNSNIIIQNNNLEMQQYHQATPTHSDHPFVGNFVGGGRAGLVFPDLSTPPPLQPQPHMLPWDLSQAHHSFPQSHHDPFFFPSSSSYGGLFTRRPSNSLQFAYEGSSSDHLRLLSDALGPMVQPGSAPFGLQAELNKMTAQEIMDAKALAASKSHSEAERRRRERINNHLAKLRSLLPSTTKTDKASLLAEVIQHVKELRRQTSIIAETSVVPTETDELTVDAASDDQDGKFIIKASLCCDDRSDLLPDLIKALKTLRLKTLKAEITTLGGRVKNVLFVTHEPNNSDDVDQDDHHEESPQCSVSSIQEALKAVIEKSGGGDESTSGNPKRQRTANITIS